MDGKTGVWVDGARKVASIGIACRRWVIFHGLGLNVNTDLSYFQRINPCGLSSQVMGSIESLGATVPSDLKQRVCRELARAFGRTLLPAAES